MAGNACCPLGWRQQRRQHTYDGGFAGAVRAEECHQLPFRHVEVEAAYRLDDALLGLEAALQSAGMDHCFTPQFASGWTSLTSPADMTCQQAGFRHAGPDVRTDISTFAARQYNIVQCTEFG
ncbi:hypothetical protein D3C72_2157720 [compost metagenome]